MCANPYDPGTVPMCPGAAGTSVPTYQDPRTDYFIPYFPAEITSTGGGRNGVCACTAAQLVHGTCPTSCSVDCTTTDEAPGQIQSARPTYGGGSTVCSPWAYSYGFFTGTNDVGGSVDYSKELEIQLTSIDFNTESFIGNFIQGEGIIQHQYDTAINVDEPWIAYFTGGDRITRTNGKLQNNEGGRFRLEVSINLECHFSGDCWLRSPVATSLPVVPIPYTARNDVSLYDYSFSTFRIAAFDLDAGEQVYFFHANNEKYGSLVGHGIPEGTYPNNPTREEYMAERSAIIFDYCNNNCLTCPAEFVYTREDGTPIANLTSEFCTLYPEWTYATRGYHTAGPPPRLMIDPYTGVVHWQTGPSPFQNETIDLGLGTGGYALPTGWSSMDPAAHFNAPYAWRTPDNNTYDGWVYNRKTFSYMKYSDFSDCDHDIPDVDATDAYSGGECTTSSLKTGFYNLVVDIRSKSGDSCLAAGTCMSLEHILASEKAGDGNVNMANPILGPWTPQDPARPSKRGYNTIPLDFLLYLYPTMHMCSNCDADVPDFADKGMSTFKDSTGAYGFDQERRDVESELNKFIHRYSDFQGTGKCFICGGSSVIETTNGTDPSICGANCLFPTTSTCKRNTRPYWLNKDYTIANDPFTPAPNGINSKWTPEVTRPTGGESSLEGPFWGEAIETATFTVFKGDIVEFNLTAADDDDCVELWIYDTGMLSGQDLDYCRGAHVSNLNLDAEACEVLDPAPSDGIIGVDTFNTTVPDASCDPNDPNAIGPCPEVTINLFDMYLGPHTEAYIDGYASTTRHPVLARKGNSVRRTFQWPAVEAWPGDQLKPQYDPRPENTTVCFFAFDGYLFSDFRCINIIIVSKQNIYWSDRRPGLNYLKKWNVIRDLPGFQTGTFTITNPDTSTTVHNAPLTLANQTRIVVNVGDLVEFDMQAKQASSTEPLDLFISQGVLPDGASFVKTTDTAYISDPVRYKFSWRPTKGQECEYTICFLASNKRGTEYPMTVDYESMSPLQGPRTPFEGNYGPTGYPGSAPYIDERCYTIEVTDMTAHLTPGSYIDVDSSIVSTLDEDCGYSVGGWFFAEEAAGAAIDMALISVGSTTGAAMSPAHQLLWQVDASSDDLLVGTENAGVGGVVNTGSQYRYLAFYELGNLVARTTAVKCDGGWHYFFLTVDTSKAVKLYLDGAELEMAGVDTHEFHKPPEETTSGSVTVFPAQVAIPAGATPALRIGSDNAGTNFEGWLNDIRVYSRALTGDEVSAQMFATCTNDVANRDNGECLALEDADMAAKAKRSLELWLNFNDRNNANPLNQPDDPINAPDTIHGCTSDALPAGASFSRYLACGTNRDVRDTNEWGGSFEYCNDYTSLVGASFTTPYVPDIYSTATRSTLLPQCLPYQCYAKAHSCGTGTCNAADFTSDKVCSYQCSDVDNSFHGSGFSEDSAIVAALNLESDSNGIPFLLRTDSTGYTAPVGSMAEMDTPYTPYAGEMTMIGYTIDDKSLMGRTATAVAGMGGLPTFEYKASPAFAACPSVPVPNVVHVDGGQEIVIKGFNFAESQFLRCNFGGYGSTPATVAEYDNRGGMKIARAIRCKAPGFSTATASAVDVTNSGDDFTDFNIPVYFTESAAYFGGAHLLEIDPVGVSWLVDGFSAGMWFDLHEPKAPGNQPVHLIALEWGMAAGAVEHLIVSYDTTTASIDVAQSANSTSLISYAGAPGKELNVLYGTTGWHYVMVTLSPGGELTLYVDGDMAGSASVTMPGDDAVVWVGGRHVDPHSLSTTTLEDSYTEYLGFIDELSLFNKEVSVCEMRQWMWGNLTRGYDCPSGQSSGLDKQPYMPRPSGLLAHFGFDGLSYNLGARSSGLSPFEMYGWNLITMRYDITPAGDDWEFRATDMVLIDGKLSNGNLNAPDLRSYSSVINVGYNMTTLPALKFVTVPFLAPSFNAPRRKICGNVRMATYSRAQAFASDGESLADEGNFMYVDLNFQDTSGSNGYTGGVASLGEPSPMPNRCEQNHQFLVDSVVPVEGYSLPEPYSPSTSTCTEQGLTVYGFGFAKSPWLTCMQGDVDGNLSPTAAHYISAAEIRCSATATERPYKYKYAVSNNHLTDSESCEEAPESKVVETPEELLTKDMSLYFDGASMYARAEDVSSEVDETGVTFGAWFFPTRESNPAQPEQEPILAFTTACGGAYPLFDSINDRSTAGPVAVVVGATYSNGKVCLTSDLPYYSNSSMAATLGLDLSTTWDESYGLLDTKNSTLLCLDATPGEWHYVEVSVNEKEIQLDIPSDGPKVSYLATLNVDGQKIGGDEDGGDSSLRVPALPLDDGLFFIGGVHCYNYTMTETSSVPSSDWVGYQNVEDFHERFFQGMIDEVRVYKGVQTDLNWLSKAEDNSDLVAYYTFTSTRGNNQRRQTPHCEEFAAGEEPVDCIKGGAYFSRGVEEFWAAEPQTLRYDATMLRQFPRPTGYYPVARGSPVRPAVYPDLVTHTFGLETCNMPTVGDQTYAGTHKAAHNLLSDVVSFPVNFNEATKHPYVQGGPSRFNHFIPEDSTLYNYADGPETLAVNAVGSIYAGDYLAHAPDFRYMEVPWFAATVESIDEDMSALDGGRDLSVSGYNIARSMWLSCKFNGLMYDNHTLSLDEDSAFVQGVLQYGGWEASMADTVRCPFPGSTIDGSDWLKVPGLVSVEVQNPESKDNELITFKEVALSLGGSVPTTSEVAYAAVNFHDTLSLSCPDGLRLDTVEFASYGRPQKRCNKQSTVQCDGTVVEKDCKWQDWKVTKSCDSDVKTSPGTTASIIRQRCFGKKSCFVPAKDEVFGDPCVSKNKWLSVAMTCSDRWKTKDAAIMSETDASTLGNQISPIAGEKGNYTFSAWIKPGTKAGRQAVAAFGCKDCAKMNRGVLQWVGMDDNMGMFHYYDDYIQDVIMKREDGSNILLAAGQWYHVAFSVDSDNSGSFYLNGHSVAVFSTASRPASAGESPMFTLGMDMDSSLHPKEFFEGMIDEVRIFKKSLTQEEVFSTIYWTVDMGSVLFDELVAYYKFNNMAEQDIAQAYDETSNNLHLTLLSSATDNWDPVLMSYDVTSGTPEMHVTYEAHGAPWFPATTYALDAEFSTAPLGAGLASFDILGVNFVKGMSRVYYGGEDVTASVVEITDTKIDMLLPDGSCEGGESSVYVTNVPEGSVLSVPEETVTQAAEVPDLQNGLICYFPFFGGASDWSGNDYHAEIIDGADLTEDRNGFADRAYSFDGDDAIKVPDCVPSPLTGKSITTVAMWVKYADIQFPEKCSEYPGFEEEIGFVGCEMQDHAIMTHAWKLIAAVKEEDGSKVYVNGIQVAGESVSEYLDLLHKAMVDQEIGGDGFVGLIDDVWMYDRALCDAELLKLYNTQTYAVEMDGNGGLVSPVMSSTSFRSPGVSVKLITSTAATGTADNSVMTQVVVDLSDNSEIVNHGGNGVLESMRGITVPSATATDAYSMVVEANVYAPFSSTYTFSVTTSDEVYCWLKNDLDQILYTITSSQRNTVRTHERQASLMEGNWYSYYCAYTKLTDDFAAGDTTPRGLLGLRWRSADGQINGPLSGPYVRSAQASELVVAAWVHPYETEGRIGILSLKGDDMEVDEMARFGLSIVDGTLSVAFYTGDEGATCDASYYREARSVMSVIVKDQWQHVAVSYDGKTVSFFVDGRMTEQIEFSTYAYLHVAGDVELMVGADASSDMFMGQVYSVAMYNKVPDDVTLEPWVMSLWECPITEPEDDLIFNLLLNEGVGEDAKDFSLQLDHPNLRTFGDAKLSAAAKWVDATCSSLGADALTTEYAGQALIEGLAGQCMVFSIQARDKCGRMRVSGGDDFTVEVVGPLHLHSEIYELTVGDGIEDMNDGSYLVHFTREISGYYLIYVKLNGEIVPADDGEDAVKTYVHTYVTNAMTTYMYDEEDMLGLDELHESCAGVPVAYMIQTVDAYENLRTMACDTDAFEVKFDGPYSFDAKVTNLEDGRFRVNYNAEVAGPYQMRVAASVLNDDGAVETEPVSHSGGYTCAGWGKSEHEYCSLHNSIDGEVAGDDLPFCVTVHECSSLRTTKDSIYASFPDTDDLDLEGSFTVSAWVMPVPEAGEASRQYILSKQSEYSGKGYWLALLPGQYSGFYSLELGVYVGNEEFRTISKTASMPAGEWSRVGATYDGTMAQLFVAGKMIDEKSWDSAKFQRRNAQPLRVGKAFSGMIDNVMLFNKPVPEKLMDMDVAMCPSVSIGEAKHDDLIAYYRFNEGATRGDDGDLVPQKSAWATKDSSGQGNDGFVGLFSDETGQNKEMHIKCPAGYAISEILFANYGSSKGGFGTYEVDECGAKNSVSAVESRCIGRQSCKVMAGYSIFGNPCKHATKTLAVNAICAVPASSNSTTQWAVGMPAPHWVGTTAAPKMVCPYADKDAMPESFHGILPDGTCDDWDVTKATAGETEYFLLEMVDKCGYKNRYPQKMDGYVSLVDTSILALGGTAPYEPVFSSMSDSVVSYPHVPAAPELEQCGIQMEPEADALPVDFKWGGENSGYDTYCSRYRDLYLGWFTPTDANDEATLVLSLSAVEGDMLTVSVDVMPAAISAAASTTCAATETAPECESGCMDIMAEAGVEAMFEFVAKDEFGNQLRTWDDMADLSLVVEGGNSAIHTVMQGSEEAVYEFYVIFPHEGNFTVTVKAGDDTGCSFTAHVSSAIPHKAVVYGTVPEMRFEHSMVEYEHNLYVFGGVSKDKSYLSETWKLETGYATFAQGFNYRRSVDVTGLDGLATAPLSQVVEMHLPTAAWMEAGKLQADCADILLLNSNGERIDFWVEPRGAPFGCGAETTKVWVEVAAGVEEFHLYYGNKGFDSYASSGVFAKDGMGMFEDFEYTTSPLDNGWVLDGAEHDTCTPLEPGKMGDPKSFTTSMDISLSGDRSLMVDAYDKIGGSIKKMGATGLGKNFVLKGYFYDTMCNGYHYLSPDFGQCQPVDNSKALLPDFKNALGVYTDSKADQYCHTYPWMKAGMDREQKWHSFTFKGNDEELKLYIDEEMVVSRAASDFSSMFIAGGMFLTDMAVSEGTKAYWDSILVTPNYGVATEVSGDEEAIFFDEAHMWVQVGLTNMPPVRQGHSAAVADGKMYIFGGERSAYHYSDIWKYDMEEDIWEFVAPYNSLDTLGRHDHSAVIHDGVMYIYGGRSDETKGDLWAFDFATMTWTEMPMSPDMAPRHGHGAAVIGDAMYVYGGYISSTFGDVGGTLTDEVWAYSFSGMSWTLVGPRMDNYMVGDTQAHIADPYEAMQFPMDLPTSRLSFVLLGRTSSDSFYVFGGTGVSDGGASTMGAITGMTGFHADDKKWSTSVHTAAMDMGRFDAAGALVDDMWACVHGGLSEDDFMSSIMCAFVGDKGLSQSS